MNSVFQASAENLSTDLDLSASKYRSAIANCSDLMNQNNPARVYSEETRSNMASQKRKTRQKSGLGQTTTARPKSGVRRKGSRTSTPSLKTARNATESPRESSVHRHVLPSEGGLDGGHGISDYDDDELSIKPAVETDTFTDVQDVNKEFVVEKNHVSESSQLFPSTMVGIKSAICENGHVLDSAVRVEKKYDDFCNQCGASVFTECKECGSPINEERINYITYAALIPTHKTPPYHCSKCGKSFPWDGDMRRVTKNTSVIQFVKKHPTRVFVGVAAAAGFIVSLLANAAQLLTFFS